MPEIGTRALKLEVEGDDYSAAVSKVEIVAAESDSDFTSFADAAAGGSRKYTLELTMKQDTTSTALWQMIWGSAGDTVDCVVRPAGGTAAGTATPQFVCQAIVSEPDGTLLGGSADKSASARMTVDVSWELVAKPTLDTTP